MGRGAVLPSAGPSHTWVRVVFLAMSTRATTKATHRPSGLTAGGAAWTIEPITRSAMAA